MTREIEIAIQAAIEAGERIMEIYNDPNSDFGIELKADNSPLTRADKAAHTQIVSHLETLEIPILSEEGRAIAFEERSAWDRLWIVDPLDGTKEFIKRNGDFTVNIALVERGVPVAGVIFIPVTGELYVGTTTMGAVKVCNVTSHESVASITSRGEQLPLSTPRATTDYIVVASLSHLSPATSEFVESLRPTHPSIQMTSRGSSLKICMLAEGAADIYPRFAPTMEWDTAAGDAILRAAGGVLNKADRPEPLDYNKPNLLNPYFIATR